MDERTIRSYNIGAHAYADETAGFWVAEPQIGMLDVFAALANRGSILNVGSGPGFEGVALRSRGLEVTCLDASEAMIELSRARGLESVLGDLLELPFDDNEFDGVWAYTSLVHIPRRALPQALSEIVRVTKPGGYLGLGMIEGRGEEYRVGGGVESERFFSYYHPHEIELALIEHGFRVHHYSDFTPHRRTFLNYIASRAV